MHAVFRGHVFDASILPNPNPDKMVPYLLSQPANTEIRL